MGEWRLSRAFEFPRVVMEYRTVSVMTRGTEGTRFVRSESIRNGDHDGSRTVEDSRNGGIAEPPPFGFSTTPLFRPPRFASNRCETVRESCCYHPTGKFLLGLTGAFSADILRNTHFHELFFTVVAFCAFEYVKRHDYTSFARISFSSRKMTVSPTGVPTNLV